MSPVRYELMCLLERYPQGLQPQEIQSELTWDAEKVVRHLTRGAKAYDIESDPFDGNTVPRWRLTQKGRDRLAIVRSRGVR